MKAGDTSVIYIDGEDAILTLHDLYSKSPKIKDAIRSCPKDSLAGNKEDSIHSFWDKMKILLLYPLKRWKNTNITLTQFFNN